MRLKIRNTPVRSIPIVYVNSPEGQRVLKAIKKAQERRDSEVSRAVLAIIMDVRRKGDAALFEYTKRFDGISLSPSKVCLSADYLKKRAAFAPPALKRSIREAAKRIKEYHSHQGLANFKIKTADGELSQIVKPLKRVGIYIPGGRTVYPSSVLMNAIPAQIAGVKEIVAVTPPRDDIDPGVAYALYYLKITEIYRIGGAQAIAALAYGTKTIPAVDKIVGPGNSYVAAAKRLVYGIADIDTIAGPSEVAIIADKSAPPRLVALDLLAQAEHGSGDEIAICIVENKTAAGKIAAAIAKEFGKSPVRDTLLKLPPYAITIFIAPSREDSIALSDEIAPEHLQIMTATADKDVKLVNNAAAVFLGMNTPVALGDYFIGTNHVLPTGGAARYASPLGVESFQKRISVAKASPRGIKNAAAVVPVFARAEAFVHHAMSVEERVRG